MRLYPFLWLSLLLFFSCNNNNTTNNTAPATVAGYDKDALQSVIASTDSLITFDFVKDQVENIKSSLQQPVPVLLCRDSLNSQIE